MILKQCVVFNNYITTVYFQEQCQNYIRVLVQLNDEIFVCGTNAFSPKCSWRSVRTTNAVDCLNYLKDAHIKCNYRVNVVKYL